MLPLTESFKAFRDSQFNITNKLQRGKSRKTLFLLCSICMILFYIVLLLFRQNLGTSLKIQLCDSIINISRMVSTPWV